MRRPACLAALAIAATPLAGCNTPQSRSAPQPAAPAAPAGYATRAFAPPGFSLPSGGGCGGDVARFRAVMANDYQTGNVGLPVYRQITGELDAADRACAAGNAAQASAIVRATRARFGYPAG